MHDRIISYRVGETMRLKKMLWIGLGLGIGLLTGLVLMIFRPQNMLSNPFGDLSYSQIEKVALATAGKLAEIELTQDECQLLVCILNEVEVGGVEKNPETLYGHGGRFAVYDKDGTVNDIHVVGPYVMINDVVYKTAADGEEQTAPCRQLEKLYQMIYQRYQETKDRDRLKSPFSGCEHNQSLRVYAMMGGYIEELSEEDKTYFAQCLSGIQLMEVVDSYRRENKAINGCQFRLELSEGIYTDVAASAPYFFMDGVAYETFENNVSYRAIADLYDKYVKIIAQKIAAE